MLLVDSEKSEANDGSGNAGNQIGDVFQTADGQHYRPYNDDGEQGNE